MVTFKGNPVKLEGNTLKVGDKAPVCTVVLTDLSEKEIGGAKGKAQLIITVPSLDTPVCATETKKFNEKVGSMEDVDTTIVSMDLPFASKRFCTTENIGNVQVGSDFRYGTVGKNYGVLIEDTVLKGLLARAVFVVDKNGNITYIEFVPEITEEPNYDKVLEELNKVK